MLAELPRNCAVTARRMRRFFCLVLLAVWMAMTSLPLAGQKARQIQLIQWSILTA
jgi:hypothetical protein